MPARIPMTERQRAALLALPDTEDAVVRYHSLSADDLVAIAGARTPETRLGYALQLCCLRYPGRHLREGETLPAIMLDHIAEQIGIDADALAGFARGGATRYEQLALIKQRHGYRDLTHPLRAEIAPSLAGEAIGVVDGRILIDRLIARLRAERIVIPGVTVVERMAAEAMLAADRQVVADIDRMLTTGQRGRLNALLSEKEHSRKSRLSWLREPATRVGSHSMAEILDKLDLVKATAVTALDVPGDYSPRLAQMAREGKRHAAQRLAQINRQIEAIDAALNASLHSDLDLAARFKIIVSIPGIGTLTAITMLIEMPELGQLDNKQAASLAGLAPQARDSGQHRGKRHIRGGRAILRQALYMPARVATRYNADMKAKYQAMTAAGKPAKVAITAVMRKLIILANALLRANRPWTQNMA